MLQPLRARRDYDEEVEATMIKPVGISPGVSEEALMQTPEEVLPVAPVARVKFTLVCPECSVPHHFQPEEGMTPEDNLICPKCASSAQLKDFVKTKEGSYVCKTASSSLSGGFRKLRKMLPKGDKVTLTKGQISEIHSIINSFKSFYDKVQDKLD